MCGQVGIIFGQKRRRIAEREYLNEVFIRMLLCSEERGPHASGMAWLRTDGDFRLFKRPIRAHQLVRESTFHGLMAEVDSELLFRLADRFAPDGTIDGRGFRKALRLFRGQMSAVLASRLDPGAITVIKGNKPLSLRYSRKHRAVFCASEPEYIEAALDDLHGWRELEIPPLTMLTFRHEILKEWQSHPFKFVCQERKGTLPEGVKA